MAKDHVATHVDFVDNMDINYEDIYTQVFVESLEGELCKWFCRKSLDISY